MLSTHSLTGDQRGARLAELELIYRTGLARFVRTAALITGDGEGARDLVQEAFALAVRGRQQFARRGSLKGWIWRILVNSARAHLSGRRETVSLAEEFFELAASNGGGDLYSTLRALVAELHERQRLAVFLRYYADLDCGTIAETLGVREGTVAATLAAARKRLRAALEQEVSQ
ncbi:MAG: sigma-70 family RNA polymerase sigma factor [Thermoleophilia bacterium]|nr:sigma-70 family RNA polymerase sigma factor [Thermoleophilia bacterium]